MFDALIAMYDRDLAEQYSHWLVEMAFSPYITTDISETSHKLLLESLEIAVFSEEIVSVDESHFFEKLQESPVHPCMIIVTCKPTVGKAVKYLKAGAYDYLVQPVHKQSFCEAVHKGIENKRLFFEILSLSERIKESNRALEEDKKKIAQEKEDLNRLFKVIKTISETLDVGKILSHLAKAIHKILPYMFVSFVLEQESCVDVVCKTSRESGKYRSIHTKQLVTRIFHLYKSEFLTTGKSIIQNRPLDEEVKLKLGVNPTWEGGFYVLPLCVAHNLIGTIVVYMDKGFEPLTRRLTRLLMAIVGHAGVVLNNAQEHRKKSIMAITDSLTGLYNKNTFYEYLSREIKRAYRYGKDVALMMLDLDHFKQVNDTYGHQIGDKLLRDRADLLKSETRQTDIVARFGGEEFVVILPETNGAKARFIAERIRQRFETIKFSSNGAEILITVSIGISSLRPGVCIAGADMLRLADQALYEAKSRGRNMVIMAASGD